MDELFERIVEALHQCVDDMGDDGQCVCPAAKAQAILVLLEYRNKVGLTDVDFPLPRLDMDALIED
jgi:hypothetical protein